MPNQSLQKNPVSFILWLLRGLILTFFILFFTIVSMSGNIHSIASASIVSSPSTSTIIEMMSHHTQDIETLNNLKKSRGCLGFFLKKCDLSGSKLANFSLSGADLSRVNLSEADLSGVDLSGAYLIGTNFENANLSRAVMVDTITSFTNFKGANLSGSRFEKLWCDSTNSHRHHHCDRVRYSVDGNFSNVDFSNSYLEGVDFGGSNLENTNFSNAQLINTSFGLLKLNNAVMPDGEVLAPNDTFFNLDKKYSYYTEKIEKNLSYYNKQCYDDAKKNGWESDLGDWSHTRYKTPSCQNFHNVEGAYRAIKGEWNWEADPETYMGDENRYRFKLRDQTE
jgi:hypothetical protein